MKPKTRLAVAALICLQAVTARASTFTLNLDRIFSTFATTPPSSPIQPWLTATFTDNGPNDVILTMNALNLSTNFARPTSASAVGTEVHSPENVIAWWFNINPLLSTQGSALNLTFVNGVTATVGRSGLTGQNGQPDPTGRLYDFRFNFNSLFTNGLSSTWDLKGVNQVIHASDFVNFFDTPDGAYESAANIKNTVNPGAGKGPFFDNAVVGAVPEPATWLLCMMAVPVLIRFSRRRKP